MGQTISEQIDWTILSLCLLTDLNIYASTNSTEKVKFSASFIVIK